MTVALGAALPLTAAADEKTMDEGPDIGSGYWALGVNLPLRASPLEAASPRDAMATGAISRTSERESATALIPTAAAAITIEPEIVVAIASPASDDAPAPRSPAIEPARPVAPPPDVAVKELPPSAASKAERARAAQKKAKARVASRDDATTASLIGRALDQPANDVFSSTSKTKMAFYFGD
ncbi:MAG: hypothetical protein ACKVP4_12915 [Hyphomicrobium sp.]